MQVHMLGIYEWNTLLCYEMFFDLLFVIKIQDHLRIVDYQNVQQRKFVRIDPKYFKSIFYLRWE